MSSDNSTATPLRAVTGYFRLPILAIAAILIAGCGATPASSPGTSAEPAPRASAAPFGTHAPLQTPWPLPSGGPLPTPEPTAPDCPPPADAGQTLVYLLNGLDTYGAEVQITSIAPVAQPSQASTPARAEIERVTIHAIGGHEMVLNVFLPEASWPQDTLLSALRATLRLEGKAPIHLPVRLDPRRRGQANDAIVTVPDMDTTGILKVEVEWFDPCFVLAGSVSSPVRIYGASTVADCAQNGEAASDQLSEVFEPPIHVGSVSVALHPWLFTGKVTPLGGIDPPPPYVRYQPDSPGLTAGPGATIEVANPNELLELHADDELNVIYYRRGPLLRWLEAGWIHGGVPADVVFRSNLVEHADGTFTFDAPTEPARYVAQVAFTYESACSFGTAGFPVEIEIVAP